LGRRRPPVKERFIWIVQWYNCSDVRHIARALPPENGEVRPEDHDSDDERCHNYMRGGHPGCTGNRARSTRRRQRRRTDGPERRQFRNGDASHRPEVNELAQAIDRYKLQHRRRFITFEELYDVMQSLGYHK
jgi:hypothetical protein